MRVGNEQNTNAWPLWLFPRNVWRAARGIVLLQQAQFPGAIAEFERAIAFRPRDHVLWFSLGVARRRKGITRA